MHNQLGVAVRWFFVLQRLRRCRGLEIVKAVAADAASAAARSQVATGWSTEVVTEYSAHWTNMARRVDGKVVISLAGTRGTTVGSTDGTGRRRVRTLAIVPDTAAQIHVFHRRRAGRFGRYGDLKRGVHAGAACCGNRGGMHIAVVRGTIAGELHRTAAGSVRSAAGVQQVTRSFGVVFVVQVLELDLYICTWKTYVATGITMNTLDQRFPSDDPQTHEAP